jgi:predicted ester cyclase
MAAIALLASCGGGPTPEQKALMDKEVANKAAFEKLMSAWDSGNEAILDSLIADNFVEHNPDPNIHSTGRQHWKDMMKEYKASFPDMKATPHVTMVDGDWVAGCATVSGTNTGPMGPMPATNKPVKDLTGIDLCRFENGRMVEHWGAFDAMSMMMQLGMMGDMGGGGMAMEKEHVCNPGCKGDKHNYLHGEKGHVCSPDCPEMKKTMEEKKG